MYMNSHCTTATATATPAASVLRNVEWSASADVAGPILRRASNSALLHDDRVQISFDEIRGEYVLGLTVGC